MGEAIKVDRRHNNMLRKKLGAKGARDFWHECELTFPCAYCGANPGEPCTTKAGLHVPYVHRDRREAAHDFTHKAVWDLTDADVREAEERREAERVRMLMERPRVKLFADADDIGRLTEEVATMRAALLMLRDEIQSLRCVVRGSNTLPTATSSPQTGGEREQAAGQKPAAEEG